MDEDFMAKYADEIEALDDFDFSPGPPVKGKKSLDFSTPSTRHPRHRVFDINASLNESLALQPLEESYMGENGNEDKENTASQARSRKRHSSEMNPGSDNDADLVIDADIPDIVPRCKRQKLATTPLTEKPPDDDDNFTITPPPSPPRPRSPSLPPDGEAPPDDVAKTKKQVNRNRMRTALDRVRNEEDRLMKNYDFERVRVHRKIPAGAYFHATDELGKRVYMKLKSQEVVKQKSCAMSSSACLTLLGTPLDELKQQVEEQRRKKLLEESQRLSQSVHSAMAEAPQTADEEETSDEPSLWVDRYRPNAYIELLSDETTNRSLLKWLKLWDCLVFGREKKQPKVQDKKKLDQKKFVPKNTLEVSEELDKLKRPELKVALLAGPPGLGKTTMAHVVARHAGYNVVEMNASDDRSVEVFKQKIEAATQMKAVLGADPRPNCLIIDEIDGAPAPAINMLLTIIKRGEGPAATTKRRKKEGGPLLRPIICICNDLYVPALRVLRQQALIVNVPQTIAPTLASRLTDIARREKLKTDLTTLVALCEKADNDIRSCLNTLQFVKSKSSQLSLQHIHSMSLGQKDAHKSLYNVWQYIFTLPKMKRKRYVNPHDRANTNDNMEELAVSLANNNTTLQARFINTLHMASAAGEHQKLEQGLYENYLESKFKGQDVLDSVLLALDWLKFTDQLDREIHHHQNWTLMRYISYMPVIFHLLFASNHPQRIQYPHTQFEMRKQKTTNESLVSTMVSEMVPSVRKNLNLPMTVMEVLPPLLNIIQPSLRPVNTQLYSAKEKEGLSQLVSIMIAYNITYHQERNQEGQYNYVLEPNLDDVTRFTGIKNNKQLTYAAKQLIAREIELEKMRRSEAHLNSIRQSEPLKPAGTKNKPAVVGDPAVTDGQPPAQLPSHLRQKLQPKAIIEKGPVVDFFGRRVVLAPAEKTAKEKKNKQEIIGGDIWFKFKEGFTNAVRKTVRVKDLV